MLAYCLILTNSRILPPPPPMMVSGPIHAEQDSVKDQLLLVVLSHALLHLQPDQDIQSFIKYF